MSFTSANLTTLETAIMALASGKESVTINGRSWKRADISKLQELYDWMSMKVNRSTTNNYQRMSFKKTSDQDDNV